MNLLFISLLFATRIIVSSLYFEILYKNMFTLFSRMVPPKDASTAILMVSLLFFIPANLDFLNFDRSGMYVSETFLYKLEHYVLFCHKCLQYSNLIYEYSRVHIVLEHYILLFLALYRYVRLSSFEFLSWKDTVVYDSVTFFPLWYIVLSFQWSYVFIYTSL